MARRPLQKKPSILIKRVPINRFPIFCKIYRHDILTQLSECDKTRDKNFKMSKNICHWIYRLQKNNIPTYCHNRQHKYILYSWYKQYRKEGLGKNMKVVNITCFPRKIYYSKYACWYIHAKSGFCEDCRERLNDHLRQKRFLEAYLNSIPQYDHQFFQPNFENLIAIENYNDNLIMLEEEEQEKRYPQVRLIESQNIDGKNVKKKQPIKIKATSLFSLQNLKIKPLPEKEKKKKIICKRNKLPKGRHQPTMQVIHEVESKQERSISQ